MAMEKSISTDSSCGEPSCAHDHVLRLHVAVADLLRVDGIERARKLPQQPRRAPGRQRTRFQNLAQIPAFHKLHHQVRRAGGRGAMRVNRNHVGMPHLFESGHLLLEAPLNPGLVLHLAAKDLDGAALLLLAIVTVEHVGKSAARQQAADFKARVEQGALQFVNLGQQRAHAPRRQIGQQRGFFGQMPAMQQVAAGRQPMPPP
jgi:hypothetical protein